MSGIEKYDENNVTSITMSDEMMNEEIVGNFKQPFCNKRRFQTAIITSALITVISLCVVIPVVVTSANKKSAKYANAVRYGSTWFPLGDKLLADVGDQEFGESVDLSSNGAVLAIGSNGFDNHRGQVEIRRYTGLGWREMGNSITGQNENENLGHAVQLSQDGKILATSGFGADKIDDGVDLNGVVRGYQLNERNMKWEQLGDDVIGNRPGDRFGVSLSMSKDGTSWISGADNFRGPDNERNGYAKVYSMRSNGNWAQRGSTIPGLNGERTGYAVAMSGNGDTVCVGDRWYKVPDIGKRGRARCFVWNGKDWSKEGDDMVGTAEGGEMGYSLALNYDGSRVAVGNRYGGDDREGAVAAFELQDKNWKMMGSEQVSTRRNDMGGFKVELNDGGNVMAWTARGHNGDGFDTGIVRVARWVKGEWTTLGNDLLGDEEKDYFGESVSLNGDGTIITASANRGDVEYVRSFALN